ncbi:MAG: MATE family efflux transporter [Lachnospiraceae bacterium]|nr:MATE family efflux transporter [Lachnospiraceae bacterium]
MGQEDKQYTRMTQTPIYKLIPSLAVPTIISMLTTAVYNIADTYFVSKLGTSASGAVGIVFSLMAIIQAVGFTIGMGSGSYISRLLGKKEQKLADRIGSCAVFNGLVMGVLIAAVGLIFTEPIIRLIGATDTIVPYAVEYARYIFLASPVMILCFVLNNLLRAQGKAKSSMVGILAGGLLNIALDPLLIFVFDTGIRGAAIATAVSQVISMVILFIPFIRKKTVLHVTVKNISAKIGIYWDILKFGLPSLFRQGLASVAAILLNRSAAAYGDSAVAAMSIVAKIFMVIFSVLIGFGQGYQPVVGYNYGAKIYHRVREAFWFTLKVGTVVMTVFGVAAWLLSPTLMRAFLSDDAKVVEIGTMALRMQCVATPFLTLGVVSNMTLQAVGKTVSATILTSTRQGIFFIPLILILPGMLGITGVEITQPIADLMTFVFCIPYMYVFLKRLKRAEEKQTEN